MNPNDKTPREWLLNRHAHAIPTLSELRSQSLPLAAFTWRDLLRELFQPQKTTWKILAAIWLGLLAFHVLGPRPAPANLTFTKTPETLAVWSFQFQSNEALVQILNHP